MRIAEPSLQRLLLEVTCRVLDLHGVLQEVWMSELLLLLPRLLLIPGFTVLLEVDEMSLS